MKPILQLAPLVLLILGAVWLVWRGLRTKPDDTDNKARGGGSESHYQGPHH